MYISAYFINNKTGFVYNIKNKSKCDILLLNGKIEILPNVYTKYTPDSIWFNNSESFYLAIAGNEDRSEINDYVGWEKTNPETGA